MILMHLWLRIHTFVILYVESVVMSEPLPRATGSLTPSLLQITMYVVYVVSKPSSG